MCAACRASEAHAEKSFRCLGDHHVPNLYTYTTYEVEPGLWSNALPCWALKAAVFLCVHTCIHAYIYIYIYIYIYTHTHTHTHTDDGRPEPCAPPQRLRDDGQRYVHLLGQNWHSDYRWTPPRKYLQDAWFRRAQRRLRLRLRLRLKLWPRFILAQCVQWAQKLVHIISWGPNTGRVLCGACLFLWNTCTHT